MWYTQNFNLFPKSVESAISNILIRLQPFFIDIARSMACYNEVYHAVRWNVPTLRLLVF